jgi:hypothetical protein
LFQRGCGKEEVTGSGKFGACAAAQAGQSDQGAGLFRAKAAAQLGKFGQEIVIPHGHQLRRCSPALGAQQKLNTLLIDGFVMAL